MRNLVVRRGWLVLSAWLCAWLCAGVSLAGCAGDDTGGGAGAAGTTSGTSSGTSSGTTSGSGGDGGAMACDVMSVVACPDDQLTYEDVVPIFQEHCTSCHSGMVGGVWPLIAHGHIEAWAREIQAAMETCAMPPSGAPTVITTAERERILGWLRCGAPL